MFVFVVGIAVEYVGVRELGLRCSPHPLAAHDSAFIQEGKIHAPKTKAMVSIPAEPRNSGRGGTPAWRGCYVQAGSGVGLARAPP